MFFERFCQPAPSPFFLAHFSLLFPQLSEDLLQVNYVHSFISNFLWYIFNLSVEHFWRFVIDQWEPLWLLVGTDLVVPGAHNVILDKY